MIALPKPPRRIAVRCVNWLGDLVMLLPAIEELHRLFPDAHIAAIVRSSFARLLDGHPAVHEVIPIPAPEGVWGRKATAAACAALRSGDFDLGIVFPRSFRAAWEMFRAGIPARLGFAARGRSWLLTHPVERKPELMRAHRIGYYLALVGALGDVRTAFAPRLVVPEEARDWAVRLLGGENGRPLVGLNPGATYGSAKQWPLERYVEVCRRLVTTHGAQILLIGGPAERELGRVAAAQIGPAARSVAGDTDPLQLAAVLERCHLLLTNDTGPMHVAAAVGTPVVAVFGPTDPVTTSPFGPGHAVVREPVECAPCFLRTCPIDHRCMTRIDVDRVMSAVLTTWRRPEPVSPAAPGGVRV